MGAATVSNEAKHLHSVLRESQVAFSYFDASERLVFWNPAYEDLNFSIREKIVRGALFPDLLAALVARGQVRVGEETRDWLRRRLEARKTGQTAFRALTNGRIFLVQERKDEVGGTLGFWVDISDLFQSGTLRGEFSYVANAGDQDVAAHGTQNAIRNEMQIVMGNLELLRAQDCTAYQAPLLDDALEAARTITVMLDTQRQTGV